MDGTERIYPLDNKLEKGYIITRLELFRKQAEKNIMISAQKTVDLGFANVQISEGTHICHIYSDDAERDDTLLRFLASGLEHGECAACFSENISDGKISNHFARHGIPFEDSVRSGALSHYGTREIYFKDGVFDPERMLAMLTAYHESSQSGRYPAARVIGEMSPEIHTVPGGSRLMEYESKVNMLLKEHPVTAVCQYDARQFDGETIMEVLSVHPMMVVRGSVIVNPLYIPPETYLSRSV